MKTQFKNIVAYTHQGKRPYQEDNSAYGTQYLLVSDGVGGLAKGDIASGIVVDTFRAAIEGGELVGDDISGKIGAVVDRTLQALLDYAHQNEESMGMGATLALLLHADDQYISVHIGDSRVYHFSNGGEIKWRSTDHSLVQELVTGGIITEEEAVTHPRRNVITRVLQAKEDHSTKASITVLENVVDGDVFMVCSDGVTESWSDAGMSSAILGNQELNEIIAIIGSHSSENSNDNNTAVMASIQINEAENSVIENEVETSLAATVLVEPTNENPENKDKVENMPITASKDSTTFNDDAATTPTKGLTINPSWVRWAGLGLMAIVLYVMMYKSCTPKSTDKTENKKEIGINDSVKKDAQKDKPIKPLKGENSSIKETDIEKDVNKDQLIIIEDKINEDTLYHIFKRSSKLKDAKTYLQQYPKGKYFDEIKSAIELYENNNADKKPEISSQK